jgi:carbamoyltransferase
MALAGYGHDSFRKEFKQLIKLSKLKYTIKPEYFWHKELGMGYTNDSLLPAVFGPKRSEGVEPLKWPYKDIARSLQEKLFEVSNQLINVGFETTGYQRLCLSGGVALNCENNGRLIIENEWLKDIYVQPQANDAGVALGSAYYVYFQITGRRGKSQRHVYYGSSFSNEEIKNTLDKFKLKCHRSDNVYYETSEKLSRGLIVGWFQGAAEAGPRALGNRSILASPLFASVSKRISTEIKSRENWRPYAVTVLDESRKEYLDYDVYCPFMTLALPLTKRGKDELAVARHVNNTTRPQTLKRDVNPLFYHLIKEFEKDNGIPALLNTSFNLKDEPMVNTPKEAIVDFMTSGMDVLVLGDYILEK